MKSALWTTMVLLVLTGILYSCGQGSQNGKEVKVARGSYRNITAPQLNVMLQNKDFLLVNVHVPYEGEIPDTDLLVPYNQIDRNLARLPQDRKSKIVVYCRSGAMSTVAAETLVGLGYSNVYNLEGGMLQWQQQFPLLRS